MKDRGFFGEDGAGPMKWLVFAIAGLLAARTAEAACPPSAIDVDDAVRSRLPGLKEEVRSALGTREDLDTCARVHIAMRRGASIHVEVSLPDGRTASRDVGHRDDVVPVLEALLVVPRASDPEAVPAEPEAVSDVSSPAPESLVIEPSRERPIEADRLVAEPRAAVDDHHLRIELAALSAARFGSGQRAVGVGAHSFLEMAGWLGGVEGRIDRYWTPNVAQGTVVEFAVLAGRRFHFGDLALDLTGGPAFVMLGRASGDAEHPPSVIARTAADETSSDSLTRFLASARLHFRARSTLRTFVGLDGEWGPRASPNVSSDVYRLSTWTLGFALGATVGTR